MICVYQADCTDFSTNGNGTLSPISATVTETLNGEYELQLEHPIDENGKWQRLIEGCILRAPVPAAMTPAVNYHAAGSSSIGKEIWRIDTDIPTASVRGGTLRMRNGPGDKYKVLANYKNGSIVQVLNKTNSSWYECTAPDGKHGYFSTKYLALERTETSYEAAVNSVVESRQLRDQPFRIYRVVPSLDKITVYARHIFYDLLDNMIASVKPSSSQVGASVVQQISAECMTAHDFTFYSDLDATAEEVEYVNTNPVDALLGEDGVVDKYAGELTRDWFDVYLVKRVGRDTNVQIRQGKNLLGISYDVDITDVVTRIMPTGENISGDVFYLPEVFVDSPYINNYPHPKWMHLPVSEAKESTDEDNPKTLDQCRAEMRTAAQKQFEAGCDQPTVTLNVDYINTADTEEYKDYAFLQNIYLGDAVRVIVPRIGIWVSMRMTQYTYDCLTKRYTKITLGTVADTVEGNVISSRQLPSGIITGTKLAINSVSAGALQNGSVSSAHIQMAAIDTAHIQDAAITRAKIGDAAVGSAQIQDASIIRAKIAEGAIGSGQIDEASITRAKIADAAIGTAKIEDGAINSAHIGQGEIQEAHIHDGAITHAKIGDGEIHRTHIEDGAIDSAKIADAAITNAKIDGAAIGTANIQDGAIVRAKILDGEIVTAKIADLAVTSGKIADLAVSTAKIANAAITNAQIANAAVDTAQIVLGAITAALIQNGAVGTAQIADASITEGKIVSLNADVIQSGTLATERLIIRGEDGLIYQINALASGLSMQELSEEQYREQLDGSVLVKRSVTAEQIAAATITANEILSGTITGDKIAAATIEGANLKAGIITTSHLSSEFGKTLDLSSNIGINQTVSKVYTDMETISDAAQAAQNAATSAQASADSKRRVFTSQPTPPYDAGDLWAGGSDSDLMVCAVSRSEGTFSADDWVLASSSVSDLTIGGRNLLVGTNGNNTVITQDYSFSPIDIQEAADAWDRRVTFRVKLNVDSGSWKARIRLIAKAAAATTLCDMVLAIGVLGTFEGLTLDYDSEPVNESGWATVTIQMPSTDFRVQAMIIGTGETGYAYPKLELGNSPTQWTPAPEDIQGSIDTAQQTADGAATAAGNAQSTADNAITAAGNAQSSADAAQTSANAAQSSADAAQSTANSAVTAAINAQSTADNAQSLAQAAQAAAEAAQAFAETVQEYAEGIQLQVDGKVDTWFFEGAPSSSVAPEKDWSAADKVIHADDLYYDILTGYCYRYTKNGWVRIKDSDISSAMSAASAAQDTADNKRRVFTRTPSTPYDVGDLWVEGSGGDMKVCTTAKPSGAYQASDWSLATASVLAAQAAASAAQTAAGNAQSTADNAVTAAGNAQSTADAAQTAAGNAKTAADAAQSTADNAASAASTAQSTADAAQIAAGAAQSTADAAQTAAGNAQSTADNAATAAGQAKTAADNAQSTADNAQASATAAQSTAEAAQSAASAAQAYAESVQAYAEEIEAQLDGKIDTWFYPGVPSASSLPEMNWSAEDKIHHTDDLYYDTDSGYCYRFTGAAWSRIKDSDITSAMSAASAAQDTADNKRRVFTTQPTPPYDAGDLWAGGSNSDLMVCITSRSSGVFDDADWALASSSVSELSIGGRNLLLNTGSDAKEITESFSFAPVNVEGTADAWESKITFRIRLDVTTGSWFVRIRLAAKAEASTVLGDMVLGRSVMGTATGSTLDFDGDPLTAPGWATLTVLMPSTDYTVQAMIVGSGNTSYSCPKLELGNAPTQWTPAPEDVQSTISTAQQTADNAATAAGQAQSTADTAQSTATAAQTAASTAQSTANTAKSTADTAKSTADTAKTTADTAKTTADTAKTTADTASSTATAAQSTATTAKSTADAAKTTADTAKSTADTAQSTATAAQSAASTAQSTADAAQSAADTAQSTADAAQSTATAAQTSATSAIRAAATAQETIDTLSIGGNNLIWGTLNPNTDVGERPAINGLHADATSNGGELFTSSGFMEAMTHGIKIVNTEAVRTYMQFGESTAANGSLLGLKPGGTYTLSCDAEFMLLSGTKTATMYHTFMYLYHDGAQPGTFALGARYLLGSLTQPLKGTAMEKRVEWTFTIPQTATMLYFFVANHCTTLSEYGVGDYIALDNLKLEHGHRATDWTAAPEDEEEEIESKLADIHARISNTGDSIRQEVQANYALASDMSQIAQTVGTLSEQSENNYTWAVTRVNQLQSDLNSSRQATEDELAVMRTYMTFGEDGLSIGKTGNPFTFRVVNDRLAFYMNDTEVAYLSNNKLYVTQAEILTRMIIGKFAFEPQSNGNLSLIYKG